METGNYFWRTECCQHWNMSLVLHSVLYIRQVSKIIPSTHWRFTIIAGESIPRRIETVFRKCQSDTYIVYCYFVQMRKNVTIIFDRLIKSADTDPLLMICIGPNTLMPSENMALIRSKGEDSNTERQQQSIVFSSKEALHLFSICLNKINKKFMVKNKLQISHIFFSIS